MSEVILCGHVKRLQVGEALPFAREQTSAINKSRVDAVTVTSTGFAGDEQADSFFHGGPLQAIHQMPSKVYGLIKEAFPTVIIYEGMLGENLIVSDMDEDTVCIGDVFQIGTVQVQVTRPRRPCWKIDSQLNHSGVAKFMQDQGCVGWYYRVLMVGNMQMGDECILLERDYPEATLTRLWQIYNDKGFKDRAEIESWLVNPALEHSFKDVLRKRLL
ncbi:MOSC domain-containing protein [Aquirhabdus parva]|uniref:MOSC domain-containing protein n=1 Tax=Aquirhabdus parva TaxID=2283318 RepID=A0A345P9E1_9GAMM|nr:MOSC domain-containing protein [Aquirhabdus parva]AXI03900.1 MOSC domain-containing protein [Aquirhabdus parva]